MVSWEGRTSKADADFCDEQGFPIVGGRCSLDTCNEHDYLPFTCRYCGQSFCQKHAEPRAHMCEEIPDTRGVLAAVCPVCEATVRWISAESSSEQAMEEHKSSCRGKTTTTKEFCPVEGCKQVLKLSNAFTCPKCHVRVCMTHRYEDAHPCGRGKSAWLAKLGGDAPAQASASSASSASTGARLGGTASQATHGGSLTRTANPSRLLGNGAGSAPPKQAPRQGAAREPASQHASLVLAVQTLHRSLGGTPETNRICVETIRRLLQNVSANPADAKFRSIKRANKAIHEKILSVNGAEALLKGIGFRDVDGEALELPQSVTKDRIDAILKAIV